MPTDPTILQIPQWVAGAFGLSFVTLVGALGFMLNRTFSEFDEIKAQIVSMIETHMTREDFNRDMGKITSLVETIEKNHLSKEDFKEEEKTINACIGAVKDRVRKIELVCAKTHGFHRTEDGSE